MVVANISKPTATNSSATEQLMKSHKRSISPLYLLQTKKERDVGSMDMNYLALGDAKSRRHYDKTASYFMNSFYSQIKKSIKDQGHSYFRDTSPLLKTMDNDMKRIQNPRCNSDLKRFLIERSTAMKEGTMRDIEATVDEQFIKTTSILDTQMKGMRLQK